MKRIRTMLVTLLLVAGLAQAAPTYGKSPKSKAKDKTLIGYIGDSQCGLKHPMKMGDAKACTLKCIDMGGKFILADRDRKVVYNLDKDGQEKAREFAGQKVKVTGRVTGKTIHVTSIESAA